MSENHPTLLHRWFVDVWNRGREDVIDELMAVEAIAHGIVDGQGHELRGPGPFKAFFHDFRSAFPDVQIHVEDSISAGDKLLVRCVVEATHTGNGLGMVATNKKVRFTGMCLVRIINDQIAEGWNNFDFLTMYQQLGVTPPGS